MLFLLLLCISGRSALLAQGTINANFTTDKVSGCAPLTVLFTDTSPAGVTTWAWDIDNDGTVEYATPTATHTYTVPGTYSVRLFVTDMPGTNTGTIVVTSMITVYPPLVANPGTAQKVCSGSSVVLGGSPAATGGKAPYTYLWTPGAGLSADNTANPWATPTAPTTYTLTVTDANGCTDSKSVSVNTHPQPVADAGVTGPMGPTGKILGGSPTASNGTPPYTYSWTPATGLSSTTAANPNAKPSATTSYTVTVTDSNGCQATSKVTVSMNDLKADAGNDLNICQGGTIWLGSGNAAQGGVPPYTYQWSPSTGLSSANGPNADAFPSTTTTYVLTVTDAVGFTAKDSMVLTVKVPAIADAGADRTICPGDKVTLGGSPTGQGLAPLAYWWTPRTGLDDSSKANPVASPTVTTTYILGVGGVNVCDKYDTVTIVVNTPPAPKLTAAGSTSICLGDSVMISAPAGFASYLWSNGATTPSIQAKIAGAYSVAVVDLSGCKGRSDTITVSTTPLPAPKLTANGPTTFCQGDSVQISAPAGFASYLWSSGETTPSITVGKAGNYSVMVTNSNGCKGPSDTIKVAVNPLPAPKLSANGATTFCQGDSVKLSAPAGYKSYAWSNGLTTQSITVRDSGMYFVTVTNANGCRGISDTAKVTVNALPTAKLAAGGPTDFCKGGSVVLTAPAGFSAYLWSTGATTPTITVATAGNYSVQVTNANGCKGRSDTIAVTVYALPTAKLTANGPTTFCANDSLKIDAPAGFKAYLWSNGDTTQSITVNKAGSYSVLVTNSTDCQGRSDTVTVKVNPLPTAKLMVVGSKTFCEGGSARLTAPLGFRKYAWSTGDTTQSIIVKQTGDYYVVVTNANGCSNSSDTVAITANPLPTATLSAAGPTEFCQGDSVQIDAPAGFSAYLWSNGAKTPSIVVRKTGDYSVQVTNADGCKGRSDTMSVLVHAMPNPKLVADGPTAICEGSSVTLTAPAGYVAYQWSNGDVAESITVSDSGRYYVTVVNEFGCIGNSDTVAVKVNPLPTAKLTVTGSTTFCEGSSVKLSAPAGFKRYQWSNGDSTQTINATVAGDYSVMVTNSNGCVGSSDTVSVSVFALPTATLAASGPTSFCQGDSVQLDAPLGFKNYTWSTGDTVPSIMVSKSGSYWVTVTNDNDCAGASDTVAVTVNPLPVPTIDTKGQSKICFGDSLELTAPVGYVGYLWSTGETTRIISVTDAGSYAVQVLDSTGCYGVSDSVAVTVSEEIVMPTIAINGPTSFCQGDSTELSVAEGYTSYRWSTGDTTRSIIVTQSGGYSVTVTNSDGCAKVADSVNVTVHATPMPDITLNGSQKLCQGDTVTMTAPAGFARYTWSTGDSTRSIKVGNAGTFFVGVLDSSGCYGQSKEVEITLNVMVAPVLTITGQTEFCEGESVMLHAPEGFASYQWSNGATDRVITVDTTGDYSVMVTDSIGCHAISDTVSVTVHPAPMPTISANGSTSFCDGDSVMLEASAGFARYRWSTGDSTRSIMVKTSGKYSVDVIDSVGCVGTVASAVEVKVSERPIAEIEGPATICRDSKATYTVPMQIGRSYSWNISGAPAAIVEGQGTAKITVRWADSGSSKVNVIVSDTTSGCAATASLDVVVGEPFTPVITGAKTMCAGDSMLLDVGAGYAKYLWSTGDTTRTLTVWNKGKYSVTVENAGGCAETATFTVDRIFAAPQPQFSIEGNPKYPGDTLTLFVPSGYRAYSWHKNGNWLTSDTTRRLVVRENGIYTVEVTDSNGCHGSTEIDITMWKTPTTQVSLPRMQAAPGDTISVPLRIIWNNLDPTDPPRPFTAVLRFNKSLLMPVETTPRGIIDGDDRVIMIDTVHYSPYADSSGTLTTLRFLVMLGDDESTPLKIDSFEWADTTIKLTRKEDGVLYILKLCREGGTRLFDGNGMLALKQNRPNPATGFTEIDFSTREQGRVQMTITNLNGDVVSTLVDDEMDAGDYKVGFDAATLPSGVYVCRLLTATGVRSRLITVQN
jgi:PKD repeat protein